MEYLLLGFFTGLSLILAIGAQNIFVIEQGLKKQHIFLVCLICSVSDLILIFAGVFLFHFFSQYFNSAIELIFNIALIIFLIHFIYTKIRFHNKTINFNKDFINISAPKALTGKAGNTAIITSFWQNIAAQMGSKQAISMHQDSILLPRSNAMVFG